MKQNLCISPFTRREFSIVKYCPDNYRIISLVLPKGIEDPETQTSFLEAYLKQECNLTNSIEQGIRYADVVLISAVEREQSELYYFALKTLNQAIEDKKDILCFLELDEEKIQFYKEKCEKYGIKYHFFKTMDNLDMIIDDESQVYTFDVPVFYVTELTPDCDGYDVFLNVVSSLQKKKLRVLAISEETYNILWGFKSLKFWSLNSPGKLIRIINKQIYEFYKEVIPDIILIKLPFSLMKYNDKYTFDFGMTAYAVSQAVAGDGAICCAYSGTPVSGFWDNINYSTQYKLGYPIVAVHISNKKIDYTDQNHLSFYHCPNEQVHMELEVMNQNNKVHFYDLLKTFACQSFSNYIIEEYFSSRYGVINE